MNFIHNLVHILTGAAFLITVVKFSGTEDAAIKIIGAIYLTVAIVGFFTLSDMLLGVVHINDADRWLHLVLAVVILAAGYVLEDSKVKVEHANH